MLLAKFAILTQCQTVFQGLLVLAGKIIDAFTHSTFELD